MRRPYTEDEILRAIRLHKALGSWELVAEELERGVGSLMTTVCRYRQGKWCPAGLAQRSAARNEAIEAAIQEGLTTDEMAGRLGLERSSVQQRIAALGWDAESREEVARSLGKSIWPRGAIHRRIYESRCDS